VRSDSGYDVLITKALATFEISESKVEALAGSGHWMAEPRREFR
jgi:hypothetical protein